ncbi:MAG: MFS transporter, partial [Tannerella sp.]|nr:MFS transporter [Tannerella sp.]
MEKDRLISRSYGFILAANFMLYFGFYLIMPVLPFYLTEIFSSGRTT